jgi:hypothetical protein
MTCCESPLAVAIRGKADMGWCTANVRFWPLADISLCTAHVRFEGESGHDRLRKSAFAVAIGCKADIAFCGAYVRF